MSRGVKTKRFDAADEASACAEAPPRLWNHFKISHATGSATV